jgi:hypothetical protein
LEVVRAGLPGDVAVLYYEMLQDHLIIWALTRDGQMDAARTIAAGDLEQAVERLNGLISAGARFDDVTTEGQFLFRTLIEPVVTLVGSKPRWFIVPDGPLHALPFGMLPGEDGQPLLQQRVIAIATT